MPEPSENLIRRATQLVEIERWQEATTLLVQALASDPQNYNARCMLAQCYYGTGEYKQALITADMAIATDPSDDWGHRLRSGALSGLGKHKKALLAALEAVRLSPYEPFALYALSNAHLAVGNFNESKEVAETLCETYPEMEISHLALGNSHLKLENFRQAEKCFRTALQINPESSDARNNLAVSLMSTDKVYEPFFNASKISILEPPDEDEIHRHFADAIKLEPQSEYAINNFRNQFRYSIPLYLAFVLIPFAIISFFVVPLWTVVWTVIFVYTILTAFREIWRKRSELPPDLKSFYANLPRIGVAEQMREFGAFSRSVYKKTWPPHLLVIAAVILRHSNFDGGPPPSYSSTWNHAVAYVLVIASVVWLGHLLRKPD